jgi:hypothetical protein
MIIKKGTHRPFFRFFKILADKESIRYKVTFTPSCRYNIGAEDQGDINKLYGIGYFTNKILVYKKFKIFGKEISLPTFRPMHHYNSMRFGWRYDINRDQIEILSYYYHKSVRYSESIGFLNIGVEYVFVMDLAENSHILSIFCYGITLCDILVPLNSMDIGYLLRPYFGGNQKAPHNIEIKFKKYGTKTTS